MTIIDLIRPKWRRSDPEVRIEAVREMAAEQLDTLEKIALTDPETEVRVEAIQRIDDGERLEAIGADASDPDIKKTVEARLNQLRHHWLTDAADSAERLAILEKLTDEDRLTAIASEMDDPDIRMAALARITRPTLLCKVAESNCGPAVGGEVVARLDDTELLRRLARNATNKKVRKQAEIKIEELERREDPDAPIREALENCCERLESLLAESDWPACPKALADAETTWRTCDPAGTHPLRGRFQKAVDIIEAQLKTFQQKGEVQSALENLCVQAKDLADAAESGSLSLAAIPERIADLEVQWDEIDHQLASPGLYETLNSRFQDACRLAGEECERRQSKKALEAVRQQERLDALSLLCGEAEALADAAFGAEDVDPQALEFLKLRWRELADDRSEEASLKDRFEAALTRCQDAVEAAARRAAEAVKDQEAGLQSLCEQVEAAVEARDQDRPGLEKTVRAIQAEWKRAGDLIPEVKSALSDRFQDACDRFFQVQREFWEKMEWERFANLTQKEELCVIVEALAEAQETEGLPEMVREIQSRWKTIGPVAKDKSEALWTRFHGACDSVYGRCRREKEQLIQEVREYVEGVPDPDGFETAADWEAVADAIKAVQARWKAIGPLPRSMEKTLFENFQAFCNAFFERRRSFYQKLNAERKENLAKKMRMCEEAESLVDSKDWAAAASRLKEMQRNWKSVGPASRDETDRLWQRFHTACNMFFERLEAAKPNHLSKKQDLCQQVEALTAAASDDNLRETAHKIMAIQEEWKTIGPVPEQEIESLWERFQAPCDRFFEKYRDHVQDIQTRQQENLAQKEALAAEAESLSDSRAWKETGDRLKALQKQWREIGPAPRKAEQVLWERFRSACDAFFQRRNRFFDDLDQELSDKLAKKEDLCLRLEVLAQLTSPDQPPSPETSDRAAERLRVGLEYKNGVIVPGDRKASWENARKTVRRLQDEWKRIGPARGDTDKRLHQRFRRAADRFFSPG